jgi:competence protein ComEC
LVAVVLCFVAGVAWLQVQPQLPERTLLLGFVPLLGMLLLRPRHSAVRRLRHACVWMLAAGLGFSWAAFMAGMRLADELPALWEGRDIRVTGVIATLPQPIQRGLRFELEVETVATPQARVPARVSVAWYGNGRGEGEAAALPAPHAGERWRMTLRLRRPHGPANPHGFDYEAWLLERGIRATGYVRPNDAPQRLAAFVPRPAYAVEALRERVRTRILEALNGAPYAGVIAALVMGDQRAIPASQWTVFTRTGINHLMSISGLHVTMVAALLSSLAYFAWRRSGSLPTRLPARRAAAVAGLAGALSYAAVAGYAVPAQRTVYMLAVTAMALWLGQATSAAAVLALALLVVVVLDPWAVLSPGFWLSFGAVAAILYVGTGRLRPPHWLLGWARTQWAVTLGLVPVLLAMFQQMSLVSPLANAFAIPVVSLLVVPLALAGTVLPVDAVLHGAHFLMACTMAALEWLAALPAGVWEQHAPPPWTIVAALVGIAWSLLPAGFPARWLGLLLLLPLFTEVPPGPRPGSVRVAVLDVGQGLAAVVRTANHALLYDAGPMYSPEADSGSRIVVPYLRATGIRRLDGVVVTHADNDHAGGMAAVLDAVPARWMASSLPPEHPLHGRIGRSLRCFAGQHWEWDGVSFDMLHPAWSSYAAARMKSNDRSCVLRIAAAGRRMLLAGDAEARSEREMIARDRARLRAEILLVPHHGSTTSSTPEFVAAVAPQTAIFTVGYRNRFGHPRPEVLQRYLDLGSRLLRSDRHGALQLELSPDRMELRIERALRRRYWQDPPEDEPDEGDAPARPGTSTSR